MLSTMSFEEFAVIFLASLALISGVWLLVRFGLWFWGPHDEIEWRHGQIGGAPCVRVRSDPQGRVIRTETFAADRCPERGCIHWLSVERRREFDEAVERARAGHSVQSGPVQPPAPWSRP